MRTLEEIRESCFIDDESHWIYRGAHVKDVARIYAPDFTRDPSGQTMTVQTGRRAVYHLMTGKPIPKNWRVWSKCTELRCINPDCLVAGSIKMHGRARAKSGVNKNLTSHILANRKIAAKRTKITRAVADDILGSNDTNVVLAARLGLHRETISRVRRGLYQAPGNPFQGLLR
jgi:hypothetical protein